MKTSKVLITNPEAEQMVLGIIFDKPELFDILAQEVTVDHFTAPLEKAVFEAMLGLEEISLLSVTAALRGCDLPQGWPSAVSELNRVASVSTQKVLAFWIKELADALLERKMVRIAEGILERAADREMSATQKLEILTEKVFTAADTRKASGEVTMPEAISGAIGIMEAAAAGEKGLTTGLEEMDDTFGGLPKTGLVLVAARPGEGKTSMCGNWAAHAAANGLKVGFISAEMTAADMALRMLSGQSGVNSARMRAGDLNMKMEHPRVSGAVNVLKDWKMIFDETSGISVENAAMQLRKWRRVHGIDVAFVDYLQYLNVTEQRLQRATTAERVGHISTCLAILSKELGIPIVAAAQLNREPGGGEPMLHHLRSSGEIEQNASAIVFPWRPDQDDLTRYQCTVAKNRNGMRGSFPVEFVPTTTTFKDAPAAWSYDSEEDAE